MAFPFPLVSCQTETVAFFSSLSGVHFRFNRFRGVYFGAMTIPSMGLFVKCSVFSFLANNSTKHPSSEANVNLISFAVVQ